MPAVPAAPAAVITDCLQGELEVVTEAGSGKAKESMQDITDSVPFLMLGGWGGGGAACCFASLLVVPPTPPAIFPPQLFCSPAPAARNVSSPSSPQPPTHPAITRPAGLDLPAAPLFKDALEKVIIPQVPIFDILKKFDGQSVTEDIKAGEWAGWEE